MKKKYTCSYCGKKFKDEKGVTVFEGDFCLKCRELFPKFQSRKEEEVKTVAIDLDGTILRHWEGTFDTHKFGEVLPGAREALEEMKALDYYLIIHTCRTDEEAVSKFLKENKIPFDAINTNPNAPEFDGKPVADIYIDDRAINFSGNWRKALVQIKEFETWEQKTGELPDLSQAAFIKDQDERFCGVCKRAVEDPELVTIKMEIPGVINYMTLGFYCCSQCKINLEEANLRISQTHHVSLPLKLGKAVSEHVKQLLTIISETK